MSKTHKKPSILQKPKAKKGFLHKLIGRLNSLFNETDDEGGSGGSGIKPNMQNPLAGRKAANASIHHVAATKAPYVPLNQLLVTLVRQLGGKNIPGKTSSLLNSLMPADEAQFRSMLKKELKGSSVADQISEGPDVTPDSGKDFSHHKTPKKGPRPS